MSPSGVDHRQDNSTTQQDAEVMTKRILWKLDLHVLPSLTLLWLSAFTDRTNIGNARIAGLEKDTHLHGNQFNICLAVFYVSYILVELPSNLILKKMKPSRWLPFLVIAWGTVTTLSGLVHNFSGLIAIRFFLGFCEGGLLPGIMLYLSSLYRRHELQQRVGIFFAAGSMSGAFGGLLATAILKMDGVGGLAGWRWIFILEGLATIIIACLAACFLPADLATAKFFSQEEREFAVRRFEVDQTGGATLHVWTSSEQTNKQTDDIEKDVDVSVETPSPVSLEQTGQEREIFEWGEVKRALRDVQVWLLALTYTGVVVSLYSFSLFLPTIVAGLGYRGGQAQLHTVPPYVPATVLTVAVAIISDKMKLRGPFVLFFLPIAIIGYIISIVAKNNTQRYVAVFLIASGVFPCGPCLLSIIPNNVAPHYKRAAATALYLGSSNCGGFIATFIYTSDQAPAYIRGHTITVSFLGMAWVFIALNVAYCYWENRARARGLRQNNIQQYQMSLDAGKTRVPMGDRHPDFRFTL
ncbi:hypothetical protein QCA50_000633 [Cerrena zonata]|uniref:Major facilitator superfamily (MFS) profile domain-containing protein n=1 Tax=Cerrena zonata TaxID=2478898 RepID=A0AAW0GRI2_9APHY